MDVLTYSVTEVKIMKASFVIAVVFACSVCKITSLECYQCSFDHKDFPNCNSQERLLCPEEYTFCYKQEYGWFTSLLHSEPPGHYNRKSCAKKADCTENGYFWFWGTWITCCQGDFCNV